MSINRKIRLCEWILSHNALLQIEEHVLAAQIFSFVATSPADFKELERRRILQILTLTDWHVEGPDRRATRLGLSHRTVLSQMK